MQNILIIVGSLAKQSVNRTIAQYIADKYRDQFHFTFAEIGDLPLYTQTGMSIHPPHTSACANKSRRRSASCSFPRSITAAFPPR